MDNQKPRSEKSLIGIRTFVFVDKNGNVYEADSSERALCFHTYVDVVIEKHTVHSDGSCTTLYYDAKRCTRCAALKDVELNSELNCKKCPH